MGGMGAIWRFLKRHRRKFIFAGTAIAGAYFALKYARDKLEEYQQLKMTEAFVAARKQTHYESNQRTCNATALSIIPSLREKIMLELNCENLTEQLQHKPSNKVYVWSELKLLSFTRTIVSIYATSILILTLRVQLNIIGGCNYARSEHDQPLTEEEGQVHQKYLETIQHFLTCGVQELSGAVRHAVEREMMNITLKQAFTVEALRDLVNKIRATIEDSSEPVTKTPFLEFIASPVGQEQWYSPEAVALRQLLSETNEILASQDYHYVLQSTINHGFEGLYKHLHKVFSTGVTDPQTLHQSSHNSPPIAVAKLIPPLAATIHVFCSDTTTEYLQQLLTLPCVNDLGYHVYESFCKPVTAA